MRILLVIDNLGSGGAQRQIVNLAIALKQLGHNVSVFVYQELFHFKPELDASHISIHSHPKHSRFSLAPILAVARTIRATDAEVVIAFLATPSFYAEFAKLLCPGVRLIVSERFMFPTGRLDLNTKALQQLHRLADAITVNSHHQRRRMEHEFPWMQTKIQTIYNGYPPNQLNDAATSTTSELDLLAVASVARKKNPQNLARALLILRQQYGRRAHITWVGQQSVSIEGTQSFDETNALLAEGGLLDSWTWLGERDDVPALMSKASAIIHPSFYEGLPNVICEALVAGKPVLAGAVCDHPELIDEPKRGILFDPSVPESIALAIINFQDLTEFARLQMCRSAIEYANDHLSLSHFGEAYHRLIHKVSVGE